jgi:hypothetical protein
VKLGDCSLDKLRNGLSSIECLPSENSLDWITIDAGKNTIELQLK